MFKQIFISASILTIAVADNTTEKMPQSAKPGQCFTKAFYPPKYTKTIKVKSTKKVLINDESIKY